MEKFKKWGCIIGGTALMSGALSLFFQPFSMILGGATGLGIIIEGVWDIPLWITNILINLPLFVLAYFVFDKAFVFRSGFATLLLSFFIYVFGLIPPIKSDYVTCVVFGGLLYGVGIGMVLYANSTTGGSDLAAGIINKLFPTIKVSRAMLVIDVAIILLGFTVFGSLLAMYGIMAVIIVTKAVDFVLEGLNFAKAAFIVCEKGSTLGREIMRGIDRGVTVLPGNGMYSGREKQVLMVAASRKEIFKLKKITKEIEPDAFMFVTDIREIMGRF